MAAAVLALAANVVQEDPVSAAPALQLPWPTGVGHNINGGNTYGCDTHTNATRNYYAIDFVFTVGQSVSATAAGTVVDGEDQWDGIDARGNFLEIDHGGGYRSRYLHLRASSPWAPGIGINSVVSQGDHIGYSGNTGGNGVAAHLHFDMQLYSGGSSSAYRAEPMSGVTGFGWYGFSVESGIGTSGCSDAGPGCTQATCGNIHDPSPDWTSHPPYGKADVGNYDPQTGSF